MENDLADWVSAHLLIATELGMGAKALTAVIAQAARMIDADLTILMNVD